MSTIETLFSFQLSKLALHGQSLHLRQALYLPNTTFCFHLQLWSKPPEGAAMHAGCDFQISFPPSSSINSRPAFGLFPRPCLTKLFLLVAKTLLMRMLKRKFLLRNVTLDALLKNGDQVRFIVTAIIFSQVFEKNAEVLVKIRKRYVCYTKRTTQLSLATGVESLPV